MMNSLNSSKTLSPPQQISRAYGFGFAILSFFGIVDAGYLTLESLRNLTPQCTIVSGCNTVLTSQYAHIFGIPTSVFGLANYLAIFFGALLFLDKLKNKYLNFVSYLSVAGFLVSVLLVYVQVVILKALCIYCLTSAAISTLMFILVVVFLVKKKSKNKVTNETEKL